MDVWRPMICVGHCEARSTWQNRDALQFPMGCYCAAEVAVAEAIMTKIPGPTGCRAYGMCGTFHFRAPGSPLRRPVLTEGQDLGPFVSAWVNLAHGVGTKRCARWAAACRGG
jgi:hypothetical protein